MDFAIDLGETPLEGLLEMAAHANWRQPEGRQYFIAPLKGDEHPVLAGCRRAWLFKMEPGGKLHPHTDQAAAVFTAVLIVLATHKRSRVFWQVDNHTYSTRLEVGRQYQMVKRGVVHWAENPGDTDTVHLLIEYSK